MAAVLLRRFLRKKSKWPAIATAIAAILLGCTAVALFLANPILYSGIGIQEIRVAEHDRAAAVLELDYLFMAKTDFTSRTVLEDEGEYSGDGMVDYDGALGKYRMLIEFWDMEPTAGFRKRYPAGEVFTLENIPEKYKGDLKFKVVYPQDHGFTIYIGSDRPIVYKEPVLYNVRYLGGTLQFKLYNTVDPDPNLAEKRPLPGLYRPVKCIYKKPDKTDETAQKLGDFTYEVGYGQFSVKVNADMVWETDHNARTGWDDAIVLSLFSFADGTEFYEQISRSELKGCCINNKYILVKAVLEEKETFYLFYSGEDGLYAVYQLAYEGW